MQRQWIWFFCLTGLGLLGSALCVWQWQKADFKEQQRAKLSAPINMDTVHLDQINWQEPSQWLGQRLTISGQFDRHFIAFLDNQIVDGAIGVDVLGVFSTTDGHYLLINRGWVPWTERNTLPAIEHPSGTLTLRGQLYPFSRPGVRLGDYPTLSDGAIRLPWVDAQRIGDRLSVNLQGAELRIDADQPHMFTPHWQLSVMTPEKHRAYAWQWAGLTLLAWGYAIWTLRQCRLRR